MDEEEVTPGAAIGGGFGRGEHRFFGYRVPPGEGVRHQDSARKMFPEDILTNAEYVQNGRLTPDGLTQLNYSMPFADLTNFSANPAVRSLAIC